MGGIGNLIVSLPALKALRENFSQSKITLLTGEPALEELISSQNIVDQVMVYDRRTTDSLREKGELIVSFRKQKFDLAMVASHTHALKGSLLTWLMGIPIRVGQNINNKGYFYTHKVPFVRDTHECEGNNHLVESLGIGVEEKYPSLSLATCHLQKAKKFLDNNANSSSALLIGVHAGSGYKQTFKRWKKEYFAQVADRLIEDYRADIVFTGGPQELDLVNDISALMKHKSINASGKFNICETASIIKCCQLFVSNDSGLAHIAAAVKTPLIVLFGATDDKRISPQGDNVCILKKLDRGQGSLDLITPEDVLNETKTLLMKQGIIREN